MIYFIVNTYIDKDKGKQEYENYIERVKPIVEKHGGQYLVRTEEITYLSESWKPDRIIVICFSNKEQLDACFGSKEYQEIVGKRENSVDSRAIIVEGI